MTRHPRHDGAEHAERRLKGSSDERIHAELSLAARGKLLLRKRGNKKLFAQPRNLIHAPATYDGKWGGIDIRHIRSIKGVGRPAAVNRARQGQDTFGETIGRWGF
jgi:hypothetical protein